MLSRWVLLAAMSFLTVLMGCAPDVPTDHVTLEQARADHEAGKVMLVDIRETREHKTGVAAGAVLLPMSELPQKQSLLLWAAEAPMPRRAAARPRALLMGAACLPNGRACGLNHPGVLSWATFPQRKK
jgi:hypothetical protein